MSELISRTTRGLFRDLMTDTPVGAIGAAFQDECFVASSTCIYEDTSVRRTRAQEYLEAVNWSDVEHVRRVLRVVERLLQGFDPKHIRGLVNSLHRDGYVVDGETGHIIPIGPQFSLGSLANLTDASAIREQLGRIQRAIVDEPALAIGSAKSS